MYIIARDSLPSMTSVTVDGNLHDLGLVKDLRKDERFAAHVPELARLSVSWVHLEPTQVLQEHRHPTTSLIIVTEGQGLVSGDVCSTISAGDAVLVPPGALHGFVGLGTAGFWALSIQFEGTALYEDPSKPRVDFEGVGTNAKLAELLRANDEYRTAYADNPLVDLARSERLRDDRVRSALLGHLQQWSDAFQRVLFARAAFTKDAEFQELAEAHLREELGHNQMLRRLRSDGDPWDPILAAYSTWFVERVTVVGPLEQTVLVHFVLEGSSDIFHQEAQRAFPGADYFELHKSADEGHFQMGLDRIKAHPEMNLTSCLRTLREGWTMMDLLSRRIAELAQKAA